MPYKLVVAKDEDIVYSALLDGNRRLIELGINEEDSNDLIGKIYIGKVVNVIKGMNAAFINIGRSKNAYMSLDNSSDIFYTKSNASNKLSNGDEIMVQIIKEEHGSKGCVVSPNISLTGRYVVLTKGKNFIGLSGKIKGENERKRLKDILEKYVTESYGFIIRTNAYKIQEELIENEVEELVTRYNSIIDTAKYRTCYTEIYKGINSVLKFVRDMYDIDIVEYIFDDKELYQEVRSYFEKTNPELMDKIRLYKDKNLSLMNLYGLNDKIRKALCERVWLKSGGCIVIQPTEALVSIDVNTAKFTGKKNLEETIFKTNIEAAKEIAHQIRLRNLSGIIVVDFIDMKNKEHNQQLLRELSSYVKKDRNKVFVVGMTGLGLVEMTRKKTNKPLYQQLANK
ncbi:Rne/Rng family ribonuclease [Vallitalea guaymasensis]|uniref:Ribonuclease E/G n=1 Tax=Vallitalea guaymasensis TaxID=1185412 RepID=A0A8J8MF40_9FIRM|nr:ribonuclease E/G [Vallitalea guaymasensis]QUH31648.1 ribonuclease E/G [Vallitalea guaymasensis]